MCRIDATRRAVLKSAEQQHRLSEQTSAQPCRLYGAAQAFQYLQQGAHNKLVLLLSISDGRYRQGAIASQLLSLSHEQPETD